MDETRGRDARAGAGPRRRDLLLGAGALTVLGSRLGAAVRRERAPNVLFVITDQHRASVAGFAGDEHAVTPSLDRLAREGTRFTRMYCQAPVCAPARQSILTGRYPHGHGTLGNRTDFAADEWTLASALSAAGYETALFGKLHCNSAGFKTVRSAEELKAEYQAEHPEAPKFRTRGAAERGEEQHGNVRAMNPTLLPPKEGAFHMEEAVTREAVRFLRSRSAGKPFFIWASYLHPHPPLFPPQAFLSRFSEAALPTFAPLDADAEARMFRADLERRREFGVDRLSKEELLGITRAYYASLAWSDQCIGELLKVLDGLELAEDTLVVYTSDHGEMLGEHGLLQKRCMFEGAARIPCILRQPGRIRGGAVVERVTQHVDLTAGLLDLLGVDAPPELDGRSVAPLLTDGAAADWEDLALAEMQESGRLRGRLGAEKGELYGMLRLGDLKYVRYSKDEEALFDLSADPGEETSRAGDPAFRGRLKEARARLAALTATASKRSGRRPR